MEVKFKLDLCIPESMVAAQAQHGKLIVTLRQHGREGVILHPFVIGSTGTMMFASARTLESLGVGPANRAVVSEVLKDLALSSAEKAFDVTTISKPEVSVGWTQPKEG